MPSGQTNGPRRALVTGSAGFLAGHLVRDLVAGGYHVTGLGRSPRPTMGGIDDWLQGDLSADGFALDAVRLSGPTHLFHLAGVVARRAGRRSLYETHVIATAALLDAVASEAPACWVAIASSSAVYGRSAAQPLAEAAAVSPLTDYAASKAAEELVAAQYRASNNLRCCVLRLFNLVGPGQSHTLFLSELARQVAERERDGTDLVRVGAIGDRRDYLDVRDASRAIIALAEMECAEPVINVGSGRSWSVEDCIAIVLGLSRRALRVEVDPARTQGAQIPDQRADITLLRQLTGWSPSIDLKQSALDLLAYWRTSLAGGSAA